MVAEQSQSKSLLAFAGATTCKHASRYCAGSHKLAQTGSTILLRLLTLLFGPARESNWRPRRLSRSYLCAIVAKTTPEHSSSYGMQYDTP